MDESGLESDKQKSNTNGDSMNKKAVDNRHQSQSVNQESKRSCEEDLLTLQIQEQNQNVQDTFEGTILETKRHTTDSQGGASISKQSNALAQFTPKFNDKDSKQSTTDRHRHTSSLNVVETSQKASNTGSDEDDDAARQHRSCGNESVPQFQQQARVGQTNVSIN